MTEEELIDKDVISIQCTHCGGYTYLNPLVWRTGRTALNQYRFCSCPTKRNRTQENLKQNIGNADD